MTGSRSFRVAATSARVLTGVVVAAACVVGVVVGVAAPWPTVENTPAQTLVAPVPGNTVLVCNGDVRAIGRDSSNPLQMVSAGSPALTVDGSQGSPESTALTVDDLAGGGGDVRRLTASVQDRTAPLLGAAESLMLRAEDLIGFAAAPCREALTESWLVGGSVATGTEDLVVLTNPGDVPSTVTLTVYGEAPGSRTVVVPAATQIALPLTSMAVGSEAPVVRVVTAGAPVRAVLQSSLTRTLDPIGVDLQDAVPSPQRHPVIAGVRVFEGDSDTAVLRLLSPDADGEAQVTVRAEGQTATATAFQVPLTAGLPAEVALTGAPEGAYVVHIDADESVVAAVRQEDGDVPGSDFAWVTPAPEIGTETFVAVPAGPSPRLVLVNDEEEDATATLRRGDGSPQEVTVPAGSSIAVDVRPRAVYSLSASGPVRAAVSMTAAGALAAWPVWPAAGTAERITVYH